MADLNPGRSILSQVRQHLFRCITYRTKYLSQNPDRQRLAAEARNVKTILARCRRRLHCVSKLLQLVGQAGAHKDTARRLSLDVLVAFSRSCTPAA